MSIGPSPEGEFSAEWLISNQKDYIIKHPKTVKLASLERINSILIGAFALGSFIYTGLISRFSIGYSHSGKLPPVVDFVLSGPSYIRVGYSNRYLAGIPAMFFSAATPERETAPSSSNINSLTQSSLILSPKSCSISRNNNTPKPLSRSSGRTPSSMNPRVTPADFISQPIDQEMIDGGQEHLNQLAMNHHELVMGVPPLLEEEVGIVPVLIPAPQGVNPFIPQVELNLEEQQPAVLQNPPQLEQPAVIEVGEDGFELQGFAALEHLMQLEEQVEEQVEKQQPAVIEVGEEDADGTTVWMQDYVLRVRTLQDLLSAEAMMTPEEVEADEEVLLMEDFALQVSTLQDVLSAEAIIPGIQVTTSFEILSSPPDLRNCSEIYQYFKHQVAWLGNEAARYSYSAQIINGRLNIVFNTSAFTGTKKETDAFKKEVLRILSASIPPEMIFNFEILEMFAEYDHTLGMYVNAPTFNQHEDESLDRSFGSRVPTKANTFKNKVKLALHIHFRLGSSVLDFMKAMGDQQHEAIEKHLREIAFRENDISIWDCNVPVLVKLDQIRDIRSAQDSALQLQIEKTRAGYIVPGKMQESDSFCAFLRTLLVRSINADATTIEKIGIDFPTTQKHFDTLIDSVDLLREREVLIKAIDYYIRTTSPDHVAWESITSRMAIENLTAQIEKSSESFERSIVSDLEREQFTKLKEQMAEAKVFRASLAPTMSPDNLFGQMLDKPFCMDHILAQVGRSTRKGNK